MRFKYLTILPLLLLLAVPSSDCATGRPPVGTYTPQGQKMYDAHQAFLDLQAVSETAINLNQTTGRLHLSDKDTDYVRQFALSVGSALNTTTSTVSNISLIQTAFGTLQANLSAEAKANPTFMKVLAALSVGLNSLQ